MLRKSYVADALRESILQGDVLPGQKVVEGRWASRLGVAQASVREAINTLIAEGYLSKQHGRSARVVNLTTADLQEIYQIRGVLEGLAARLIVARRVDLAPLEQCVEEIREASQDPDDIDRISAANLRFHLTLCELSGNRALVAQIRPVLCPLIAFARIRLHIHRQADSTWKPALVKDMEGLVEALRTPDEYGAQQRITQSVENMYSFILRVWGPPERSRRVRPPLARNFSAQAARAKDG